MSLIHVDDCAGLLHRLAQVAPAGETCNVFHHEPVRQSDFARLLSELSGLPIRRIPLQRVSRRHGRAAAEAFQFDLAVTTKHQSLWGDFPFRYPDLRDGLRSVLAAYRLIK
jgi:nucleoside-diphosphate-sugar epimerase